MVKVALTGSLQGQGADLRDLKVQMGFADFCAPTAAQLEKARDAARTPRARRNSSQNIRDRNAPAVTLPKEPWA